MLNCHDDNTNIVHTKHIYCIRAIHIQFDSRSSCDTTLLVPYKWDNRQTERMECMLRIICILFNGISFVSFTLSLTAVSSAGMRNAMPLVFYLCFRVMRVTNSRTLPMPVSHTQCIFSVRRRWNEERKTRFRIINNINRNVFGSPFVCGACFRTDNYRHFFPHSRPNDEWQTVKFQLKT